MLQANKTGTWSATPGYSFEERIIDVGDYYACKDLYDPVKGRRCAILFPSQLAALSHA